jgi:hypothetical protein
LKLLGQFAPNIGVNDMVSIYKELIDAVNKMEDISIAIEKDHDPSLIPELRTEKLVLKYVADQVMQMEGQIYVLNQQVRDSRRIAFYELMRQKDSLAVKRAKHILGEQDFDWRSEHQMFTDSEISTVMAVLSEAGRGSNDYVE